jgi:hypothetical protein
MAGFATALAGFRTLPCGLDENKDGTLDVRFTLAKMEADDDVAVVDTVGGLEGVKFRLANGFAVLASDDGAAGGFAGLMEDGVAKWMLANGLDMEEDDDNDPADVWLVGWSDLDDHGVDVVVVAADGVKWMLAKTLEPDLADVEAGAAENATAGFGGVVWSDAAAFFPGVRQMLANMDVVPVLTGSVAGADPNENADVEGVPSLLLLAVVVVVEDASGGNTKTPTLLLLFLENWEKEGPGLDLKAELVVAVVVVVVG